MASDKIMTKSPTNKRIEAMHKDNSLSSPTPDKKSPANHQTRSKMKFVDKNINDNADHDNQKSKQQKKQ